MTTWKTIFLLNRATAAKPHVTTHASVRCLLARWLTACALAALALPAEAKQVSCAGGDAKCLIDAIAAANAGGKADTILLSAGIYTLTASADGETGLPVITGKLTIIGDGAENTVIERSASEAFRILSVMGDLSLIGVTLRGGGGLSGGLPVIIEGGCVLARGNLAIADSIITNCQAREGAGLNARKGTIRNSTVAANTASVEGGGMMGGTLKVVDTTIVSNVALFGGGVNVGAGGGRVTIVNSTLARNSALRGSAVHVGPPPDALPSPSQRSTGSATIANSTIAENISRELPFHGRALNTDQNGSTISVQDSILADNTPSETADCPDAAVTSLGFNLVGNAASCAAFLRSNDLQGDPGLNAFVDDGTPGHGYFPLLPGSRAIDAGGAAPVHHSTAVNERHDGGSSHGSKADCWASDQIGQPRVDRCDIGAIEWVADRVTVRRARFDPRTEVLFVTAGSSAARDDVSLAVSIEGCLVETPMLRLGRSYLLLTQPACGNLDGATLNVTSSGGGSATAQIR